MDFLHEDAHEYSEDDGMDLEDCGGKVNLRENT
jgi:hypothetical protein